MDGPVNQTSKPGPRVSKGKEPETRGVDDSLFRIAFQNSPAINSIVRIPDSVIVEINDSFTKILGYRREDVLGKTPFDLKFWVHPEKLSVFREALLTHGRVRNFEVEVHAKDGSIRTMLLSAEAVEIDGVPHSMSAGVDITGRKQAEAELQITNKRLRQSEERFSKIFRTSPALVLVTRLSDGKFVAANQVFLRTTGYTETEILERTSFELDLHPSPQQRDEFLKEIHQRGFISDKEFHIRARNGQLRTLLVSAELIEIDGAPHIQTVGLDITERKASEEKLQRSELQLRESEALVRKAFRACPVLMNIAHLPDGGYVEVNDAFARWLGRDRSEIIGHAWPEFAQWDDSVAQAAFFADLERTRSLRNVECHLRLYDGSDRIVLVSADIIEINREPHVLGFAIDITEQKKAEQTLRENEARARSLYESISAAVVVHDENGFFQINSASLKLFGSSRPEEILGKQPADFSAARQPDGEDSAMAAQRHMDKALAEGVHRFEWLARRNDGTEFPVEVTLTAVQLEGRPALQAVVIDLTERKRAEAELQSALAKERELNQLKSDFVALVSHEFRTPLEIIMSSADNLERYFDRLSAAKREQLLRTINRSVRRMSGMMEEVLVLGRLETDRMTFKTGPFDLRAFCQRICDEIESATSKRCPIRLDLEGLPTRAVGDESVLRHIFTNLLSNAAKYSAPGAPITFSATRESDDVVFRVTDHGCGIPQADQDRLFQAFHRGSNVRQIPGTGLGLLIVRRCVELHGGEIDFESAEGKGTIFTVRLPLLGFSPGDDQKNPNAD